MQGIYGDCRLKSYFIFFGKCLIQKFKIPKMLCKFFEFHDKRLENLNLTTDVSYVGSLDTCIPREEIKCLFVPNHINLNWNNLVGCVRVGQDLNTTIIRYLLLGDDYFELTLEKTNNNLKKIELLSTKPHLKQLFKEFELSNDDYINHLTSIQKFPATPIIKKSLSMLNPTLQLICKMYDVKFIEFLLTLLRIHIEIHVDDVIVKVKLCYDISNGSITYYPPRDEADTAIGNVVNLLIKSLHEKDIKILFLTLRNIIPVMCDDVLKLICQFMF